MCALLLALGGAAPAAADFYNGFETDTSGWLTFAGSGSVNREADGYVSPVPYASGILSAPDPSDPGPPRHHARLRRGDCVVDPSGGGGPTVECDGPYTEWGGYNTVWNGGYTTQVDVYLDVAYAGANPDSYAGNIVCLTADPSDNTCKGTRFDFTSAIQNSSGGFLSDFVFNVGTGDPGQPNPCTSDGFVIAASNNAFRSNAYPQNPGKDPFCVDTSGWYTFKHRFTDVAGMLVVVMELLPQGSAVPLHTWTLPTAFATSDLGCNRYGWFAEQEIQDLAIDNSRMEGCGPPLPTTTTTTTTTVTTTTLQCGNGALDAGEQCDPPGSSTCGAFVGGACGPDCQCPTTTSTTLASTTTTTLASTTTTTSTTLATTTTTTSTTLATTTTTTSTTLATTTTTTLPTTTTSTTVTTTSSTTTTTMCVPQSATECTPPITGGDCAAKCSDHLDNDCDQLIDCADPDCGPGTCSANPTQSCIEDADCSSGTCLCPPIRKDPSTIRFGAPGANLDKFTSHGRVVPGVAIDLATSEVRWLVTNDATGEVVYQGVLLPGDLRSNANGTLFRYLDRDARTGNGQRSGIYRAKIRITRGKTSYGYKIQAYGDMSAATDPHMSIQFYVGAPAQSFVHGELWKQLPWGWKATGFE